MFKRVLIIGNGSSGKKHFSALKNIKKQLKVQSVSSRKFRGNILNQVKVFDPNYIIVCSPSTYHFNHLKIIEEIFTGKLVLIEKPLFDKKRKVSKKLKNRYFINYNLRYHPVLQFIRKYIKNRKVYSVQSSCSTYLPNWRKINYTKSVSAQKKLGGGVKLELSHEIDYLLWIFGNFSTLFSLNKKISNLKMNCDDMLFLIGLSKKKTLINLNLNFFSREEKREIFINGDDFTISGDLKNNKLLLTKNNKRKSVKFKKFNIISSFQKEHSDLMEKNFRICCNLHQALKVQNILNQIRWSK